MPCQFRQVQLLPENELAWELYWSGRFPGGLPDLIYRLRSIRLTEEEADQLAMKIQHLAGTVAEIEVERMKQEQDKAREK